jgi:tetratricopeptide (TPR) repeat protein
MKRRIIAGALVLLALLMTATCASIRKQKAAEEAYARGYVYLQQGKYDEAIAEFDEVLIMYPDSRDVINMRQQALNQKQRREQEEQQRQEQAARQEAERQAREEQRQREEVERQARQVRGNVRLYSAYAGTVLVNGEETQFTAEAGKDVSITIENAVGKEHTIAVRDSGGTVRQASASVNITSNSTTYRASILDPNPPPNSGDDFAIRQNAQGGIRITRYTGTRRQVVIPQTIEGIRVTEIDENAFASRQLLSVTIPNSVVTIGSGVFSYNQLTSVTIPNSVTVLGSGAFYEKVLVSKLSNLYYNS